MKQITTNQVVENTKKDRRPGKGRALALSRHIYRLQNTDTFYVESETRDDVYYFVKFKSDVLESSLWYCSCKDNSTRRGLKCKHLFAIEFAIKWGTIKDSEELPIETRQQQYPQQTSVVVQPSKSYLEDDYDF